MAQLRLVTLHGSDGSRVGSKLIPRDTMPSLIVHENRTYVHDRGSEYRLSHDLTTSEEEE